MIIDISPIVKTEGAALDIDINTTLEGLNTLDEGFIFDKPVYFTGTAVNTGGILKLTGKLHTVYRVKCYRCLKDIDAEISTTIKEDIFNSEKNPDAEAYTYEGNKLTPDKILYDNIVLNLPLRQSCSESCSGFCANCGVNLNTGICECKEDFINPQLAVLKDFFKADT